MQGEATTTTESSSSVVAISRKKADLMFVQHMVASLKSDGRMAVVMLQGVLFRMAKKKRVVKSSSRTVSWKRSSACLPVCSTARAYLRQYQRAFIAAVENLWTKYAVTTKQILAERDREAAQLDAFLTKLGYNR